MVLMLLKIVGTAIEYRMAKKELSVRHCRGDPTCDVSCNENLSKTNAASPVRLCKCECTAQHCGSRLR